MPKSWATRGVHRSKTELNASTAAIFTFKRRFALTSQLYILTSPHAFIKSKSIDIDCVFVAARAKIFTDLRKLDCAYLILLSKKRTAKGLKLDVSFLWHTVLMQLLDLPIQCNTGVQILHFCAEATSL